VTVVKRAPNCWSSAMPLETWSSAWNPSTAFGTKAHRRKASKSLTETTVALRVWVSARQARVEALSYLRHWDVKSIAGRDSLRCHKVRCLLYMRRMVERLEETDTEVGVDFANGTTTTAFGLVVAADGIGSIIRGIAFENGDSHVRYLGSYVSYFSIPSSDTDWMRSRAHWVKRGLVGTWCCNQIT